MLLYYITDRNSLPGAASDRCNALIERIGEAAAAGVDYIQLREKDLSSRELLELARAALDAIRAASRDSGKALAANPHATLPRTRLLINSRVDVALAAGADGVHLRSDDMLASDARATMQRGRSASYSAENSGSSVGGSGIRARGLAPSRELMIAVSCHTAEELALAASHGADFAVFGPVFGKKNSPVEANPIGPAGLRSAIECARCTSPMPVFALGGINLENAPRCVELGAGGVAGIRLFQSGAMSEAIERLQGAAPLNT